jgi:hypothetical protein
MARFPVQQQNTVTRYRVRFTTLLLVIVTVLYGATYQQFRHFNVADPRGADDALSYIEMSHGNYNVSSVHRYRPIVPFMASLVRKALHPLIVNDEELDKLSFYIVNFVIATGAALLLFGVLRRLGFDWQLSLLGTLFFLTSRITVLCVGTPLVDSLYFFAIAAIVYLMLSEKVVLLACICPLLVLSKETTIPFLLLPFAMRSMRNWKMVSSVLLSLSIFFAARHIIQREALAPQPPPLVAIIAEQLRSVVLPSLRRLSSPAGIHDLFNGFAFLALLAPLGLLVDRRYRKYKIPDCLLLIIPIAFGFGLISGNMGRMFFAAYVPMIAYSLVLIEHSLGRASR